LNLQGSLDSLLLNDFQDGWTYIWGSNILSLGKAYKQLSGQANVHILIFKPTDGSGKVLVKINTQSSFLLLFREKIDRVSTSLKKKHGPAVLFLHLFHHCSFASTCWATLNLQTDQQESPFQISFNIRRAIKSVHLF
jgi:hypothetical protein